MTWWALMLPISTKFLLFLFLEIRHWPIFGKIPDARYFPCFTFETEKITSLFFLFKYSKCISDLRNKLLSVYSKAESAEQCFTWVRACQPPPFGYIFVSSPGAFWSFYWRPNFLQHDPVTRNPFYASFLTKKPCSGFCRLKCPEFCWILHIRQNSGHFQGFKKNNIFRHFSRSYLDCSNCGGQMVKRNMHLHVYHLNFAAVISLPWKPSVRHFAEYA